jgi:hypothetical protein
MWDALFANFDRVKDQWTNAASEAEASAKKSLSTSSSAGKHVGAASLNLARATQFLVIWTQHRWGSRVTG